MTGIGISVAMVVAIAVIFAFRTNGELFGLRPGRPLSPREIVRDVITVRTPERNFYGFTDDEWKDISDEAFRRGCGRNPERFGAVFAMLAPLLRKEAGIAEPTAEQLFRALDHIHPGWHQTAVERVESNVSTTVHLAKQVGIPVFTPRDFEW